MAILRDDRDIVDNKDAVNPIININIDNVYKAPPDRHLTQDVINKIENKLEDYTGETIIVKTLAGDGEASMFGNEIIDYLKSKSWNVNWIEILPFGKLPNDAQTAGINSDGIFEIFIYKNK